MACLKACPWNAPQFGPEQGAKMDKCNMCADRLDNGQQTICVEACPMYALDIGPMDRLSQEYGNNVNATGFKYNEKIKPSVIFISFVQSSIPLGSDGTPSKSDPSPTCSIPATFAI